MIHANLQLYQIHFVHHMQELLNIKLLKFRNYYEPEFNDHCKIYIPKNKSKSGRICVTPIINA